MQPIKNRSMFCVLTTASQAFPLPAPPGAAINLQNIGAGQVAYVAFGGNNQVVTQIPIAHANLVVTPVYTSLGGYPILANAPATMLTVPADCTFMAAIGSAALTLVVTPVTTP